MVYNYQIIVSYDGTNFYGYQKQNKLRTIQGELEKAIIETNDMKYIKLFFKDIKNKLIAKQSNIPEITCSDEEIELENYNTLLDYIKENNCEG